VALNVYRQAFEALVNGADLRKVDLNSHVVEPVGGGVAYTGVFISSRPFRLTSGSAMRPSLV
jgi:hypothetical protein